MNIIYVLLPLPLSTGAYAYAYALDDTLDDTLDSTFAPPQKGTYVSVPLGKKEVLGVVWHKTDEKVIAPEKIKQVISVHAFPPMGQDLIDTLTFISGYSLTPLGACLKLMMPVPIAISEPKHTMYYTLANPLPTIKASAARQTVIDSFAHKPSQTKADLKPHGSPAVIRGLFECGALLAHSKMDILNPPAINTAHKHTQLSQKQRLASTMMISHLGAFKPILLDGITGSGKTEVYFEAFAQALNDGKQVLVLLPEIALSSQWLKRFKDRFGVEPAVWHSEITPTKRKAIWTGVAFGTLKVVVGARSAMHLPFCDLGFIVVDEEHDAAYKQEDGVLYNARDMAIFRAKANNCPIILSTATPSLETWENVTSGRYEHIKLTERFGKSTPPDIALLDLKADKMPAQTFISPTLLNHLEVNLERGLQSMLFLNRRGYAPLTLCRGCGHRFECNNCKAWLVQHKYNNALHCHHCGYSEKTPDVCPECKDTESLASCGPGVERIEEEVKKAFPQANIYLATSETLNSTKEAINFVEQMESGAIDIVIGTQIVTKGYHFANLTLVGVIDGDMALSGGDLRAGERTFQMLQQVAGRAGREDIQGHAYIQTTNPTHPVLLALADDDRDAFLNLELKQRHYGGQPPFHRLISIIVSDADRGRCEEAVKRLAHTAPRTDDIRILGPAEPHMPFLRGKHRRRLLVNVPKSVKAQHIIWNWIHGTKGIMRSTKVQVDVDPYSFF